MNPTPESSPDTAQSRVELHRFVRPALDWREDPLDDMRLQGFAPARPDVTVFVIELRPDKPNRGRLLGAFIPDVEEANAGHLVNASVVGLKASALGYFTDYLESLKPNAKLRDAAPTQPQTLSTHE